MYESARDVQQITGLDGQLMNRWTHLIQFHLSEVPRRLQRKSNRRAADPPVFRTLELQDENVVIVEVFLESLRPSRSQVEIGAN